MFRSRCLVGLLPAMAVMLVGSGEALACPPRYSSEASLIPWALIFPLMILIGVPYVVFRLLAPPPLPFHQERKLFGLRLWGAVLGAFFLLTLAWKERKAWTDRVREAMRQKIQLEGITTSWRSWAKTAPHMFHRVDALSAIIAVLAVMGMWTWTVTSPYVTWGHGFEVPVTFGIDTVLVYATVRTFIRRVGMHLAQGLVDGSLIGRGLLAVMKAFVLGGTAGWLVGALFGFSSALQTAALVPGARLVQVGTWLPFGYGMSMVPVGVIVSLGIALALCLPYRNAPRGLLNAPQV